MSAESRPLPLEGSTVVVTRPRTQSAALVERLEALGAEVLSMPLIEIAEPADWAPVDRAIRELGRYDWVVLTSVNGVDRLLARMEAFGLGVAALAHTRLAAVGSATADRIRERGLEVALVPADFHAEGLAEEFHPLALAAAERGERLRVLIARAEEAREVLPEALREMGCEVEVVTTYRMAAVSPDSAVLARLAEGSIDAVTLTSGAIARRLVSALAEQDLDPQRVLESTSLVTIGPVTSAALRALGFEVAVEASEATAGALAEAVMVALGPGGRR